MKSNCIKSIFLLWIFVSYQSYAETITLLEIPLDNGKLASYTVFQNKNCSFDGISEIISSELLLDHTNNKFLDTLNLLQRKINYKVIHPYFSSKFISFSLSNANNIIFKFEFEFENCILKKKMLVNNQVIYFESIEIDYISPILSPVIKSITVLGLNNYPKYFLQPWALHGQISTYELSAGLALNFHSNIRVNNINRFQKNDPVLEPVPAFLLRYGPFFLNKDGLGSLIFHSGNLNILLIGLIEGEPYHNKGLIDRTQKIFLGSILKYNVFELTYYNDYFQNKGSQLKIKISPEIYSSIAWKWNPQLFVQYWDNSYVDYYFGVNQTESTNSRLPVFKGTNSINYGFAIEGIHYVGKWSYVMNLGLKCFGSEVFNSPTMNQKSELHITSAIVYKFF